VKEPIDPWCVNAEAASTTPIRSHSRAGQMRGQRFSAWIKLASWRGFLKVSDRFLILCTRIV
jgi:hypothetical protein